ncbi:unnamed protein product [Scytosiphon promiscuus]
MATRLPRCFAAAAAAAASASGSNSSRSTTAPPPSTPADAATSRAAKGISNAEPWRREAAAAASDAAGCKAPLEVLSTSSSSSSSSSSRGRRGGAPSMEEIRASLQEVLGSAGVVRIAHADASAAAAGEAVEAVAAGEGGGEAGAGVEGDATMASPLEDGDKPEYIQRADEQAAQMRQQLRRPAQFADQFGEVSQLTQVHAFEGFRLDMSKVITPTFFVSHNVFFGNPQFPSGHYQGTLTVVGENETMVRAAMDGDCNLSMDAHAPLGMPGLNGKLTVHQGKNDLIQGTALYHGSTCSGQVALGTGSVEMSYNQAVTPRLSVGGQGQFSSAQQAVGLLYGFKYNTPSWAVLGRYIGGAGVVTAQYLRRVVPGRVTLAAEYQAQLGAASQMNMGAEFQLKQSKVSASVDSNGKVDSTLELKCGTFPTLPVTLTISSSLDHSEDKHTFGLALTCGQ